MSELNQYFEFKCQKGLQQRGLSDKPEYQERLTYEMEVIKKMGFPGYFLIVADFIGWAKANDIYIGPGRGSAAGSLVSYVLQITDVDPIRWGLLFERFLNPDRISMPDIDIDVEEVQRDRLIEYITHKYGAEHVAHIGTFNTQRAKAAVRSVAKTLGYPYTTGDHLARLLLPPIHGKSQPLKVSIDTVAALQSFYNSESPEGEVLRWARKLEDHISSVGVHASGVVISNNSLMNSVPLFRGRSDEVTTQWAMENIEQIGLIKFDVLGLKALHKIHLCIDLIERRHGRKINISQIDLYDPKVYTQLSAGDNVGLFQLETSSGMRDLMVQIRPTSLEDITALVAIYRPGPLSAAYKDIYLAVRAGKRDPEYLVPELKPILENTSGWLIYQEQIMQIAKQLCGYTGGEADDLRKAVGKKIPEKMAKHEPKMKAGWAKHGLPPEAANKLWEDIVEFAAYGFNKSHAAAYAFITYQTAWLKTYYPAEFMCSVMIADAGNTDQMIKYLAECRRMGLKVLPPDINESSHSFYVDNQGQIRFGLGPIKNLGESANIIISERQTNGSFQSLKDFCQRVDLGVVNRLKLESLVKAGAFDQFGLSRASHLDAIEKIWTYRTEIKKYTSKQETYLRKTEAYQAREAMIAEQAKLGKKSKLKSFAVPEAPVKPEWPESKELDELPQVQLQAAEHELLGFYVSSHPLDWTIAKQFGQNFSKIEDLAEMPHDSNVSLAVVLTAQSTITTKAKKEKMAFLTLEDLTGTIEAVCFPGPYAKFADLLNSGEALRVDGKVDVVEADDKRINKITIFRISKLSAPQITHTEVLDVHLPLSRAQDLIALVAKYSGDVHEVKASFRAHDGTIFRLPTVCKIGNQKGAFMRELARIREDINES